MNRRRFLLATCAGLVLADPAHAQTVVDQVVAALRRSGYGDIEVSRTLLGRTRITGQRDDRSREIVLNSRTGEILRDIIFGRDGRAVTAGVLDDDDDGDDRRDRDDDTKGDDGDDGDDSDDDNS